MSEERYAVEKALFDAGLTAYPYATAEAQRFVQALRDTGYTVKPIPSGGTHDCAVRRHADQWVCDTHYRHWSTGLCPGAQR